MILLYMLLLFIALVMLVRRMSVLSTGDPDARRVLDGGEYRGIQSAYTFLRVKLVACTEIKREFCCENLNNFRPFSSNLIVVRLIFPPECLVSTAGSAGPQPVTRCTPGQLGTVPPQCQ